MDNPLPKKRIKIPSKYFVYIERYTLEKEISHSVSLALHIDRHMVKLAQIYIHTYMYIYMYI